MRFTDAVVRLEHQLKHPLPGVAAQTLLAPRFRRDWPPGFDPEQIRIAACLLLLVPIDDRAHIVLTVRADHLGRHGGQVSLPGGVVEAGETFEHAALREAHEEIALEPASVRIIGTLTPIEIPVSGFRLHPAIGVSDAHPLLVPADGEVARILEIPVDDLLRPGSVEPIAIAREGTELIAPAFAAGGAQIWGATAMVLAEFLTLLGWGGPGAV